MKQIIYFLYNLISLVLTQNSIKRTKAGIFGFAYNTSALLLVMVLMNGCSLDENLYDTVTADTVIKTEADIPFLINGAYATYQDFFSYKASANNLTLFSGDDFSASNVGTGDNPGLFLTRGFTSTDAYVKNTWNAYFLCINRANAAINVIEASDVIRPETKKRVVGEMLFLRGFTYFNLVRFFGGVPIKTKQTTPDGNFYMKRSTIDSVYLQIFTDFTKAGQDCLPFKKQPAAEFGRVTKGAAQAMLSLAYLTYGNYLDLEQKKSEDAKKYYQLASDYADSVIISNQYTLMPKFADLFDVAKEKDAYKEVIYSIQFARDPLSSGASSKGSELASKFQPNSRNGICGNPTYGKGSGSARIQPWFLDQYYTGDYESTTGTPAVTIRDPRVEFSFLTSWDGSTSAAPTVLKKYVTYPVVDLTTGVTRENEPYLDKYKDPKGLDQRNHENDFFIIRLAEVYLIKAEALNELSRTTEAYIPFNKIRERARNSSASPRTVPKDLAPGLSKEDFRLAVFNERGIELLGEGHRWFDAIRTRYKNEDKSMLQWRYDTFYPGMATTSKILPAWNNTTKVWEGGRVQPITVKPWSDRYKLYPIPATETNSNPNFGTQNPGW